MSQYTLNIKIAEDLVSKLNHEGYKLCFARGMSDNGSANAMSVIAHATDVADTVTIYWSEEFKMGATRDDFNNGAEFTLATKLYGINYGQSFNLPEDWDPIDVSSADPAVGTGSFVFNNSGKQGSPGPQASCVVYQNILGKFSPVYMSPLGTLLPGKDVLTPVLTVAVWFQQNVSTGTMTSNAQTLGMVVKYEGAVSHDVTYNEPGVWTTG